MGRRRRSARTVVNGILWILCSGAVWRDLPEQHGPWKAVYNRFRQWEARGLCGRILDRLYVELDDWGPIDYATWIIDATSVRGSRAAVGAPVKKETPASPIPRALPRRADDQNPSCLRRWRRASCRPAFRRSAL
jgi:transposase